MDEVKARVFKLVLGFLVTLVAMAGLCHHVEYSGWVLFAGIFLLVW